MELHAIGAVANHIQLMASRLLFESGAVLRLIIPAIFRKQEPADLRVTK